MSIGIVLPPQPSGAPGSGYVSTARLVERLGFDSLYCGDHLFGNVETPDCLALLAGLATATSTLRLGTAVLLLALREPVVTAKQIATIDQLSGGRFVLGVGVGGEVAAEWEGLGVSRSSRARRTDEYLSLLRALWSGRPVDHQGQFATVRGVVGSPLPARRGGPPIWIGGRSEAALRRAARHEGWCAYALSPQKLREGARTVRESAPGATISVVVFSCVAATHEAAMRASVEAIDRYYHQDWSDRLPRVGAVGTAHDVAESVHRFVEAGADEVILAPMVAGGPETGERLQALAEALDLDPREHGGAVGGEAVRN
jgi:probable F420-dependent oxidoreductase